MMIFRQIGLLVICSLLCTQQLDAQSKKVYTDCYDAQVYQQLRPYDHLHHLEHVSLYYNTISLDRDNASSQGKTAVQVLSGISDSALLAQANYLMRDLSVGDAPQLRKHIEAYLAHDIHLALVLSLWPAFDSTLARELGRHHISPDMRFIPPALSALSPIAVSASGRSGYWQLPYGIARAYGLQADEYYDQRRLLLPSTRAACHYLGELHEQYADWELALLAYNCGPLNLNKAIHLSGDTAGIEQVKQALPCECTDYIYDLAAFAFLSRHHFSLGISTDTIDAAMPGDTVWVGHKTHILQIKAIMGLSDEKLRAMNPALRLDIIPGGGRYRLIMPLGTGRVYDSLAAVISAYRDSVFFAPDTLEKPPPYKIPLHSGPYYKITPDYSPPDIEGKEKIEYTVKPGDALSLIADWFDVKVVHLQYWNKLTGTRIDVGQKLYVYVPQEDANKYKQVNKLEQEEKNEVYIEKPKENKIDPRYEYHTIQSGETLYRIAQQYDGISHIDIMKLNGYTDQDVRSLRPGDKVKIRLKKDYNLWND